MTGHGKLTELLQSRFVNKGKLMEYGKSKDLDVDMLFNFATDCVIFKKAFGRKGIPLLFAFYKNQSTLGNILLKEGWDVNPYPLSLPPPLWIALDYGKISIAQLLIQNGANTKYTNKDGMTLMTAALTHNKYKNEGSRVECVKLLLNAGISVNANTNKHLAKPIHHAALNGEIMLLNFLIKNGAEVNAKDEQNSTPLHLATLINSCNCITILISTGADLYIEDLMYDTALKYGVKYNSIQAVETLVKNGFNVNQEPSNGCTALLTAVGGLNMQMIKLLIGLGADPNLRNRFDFCPLHLIAVKNLRKSWSEDKKTLQVRTEITEFIVDSGGNFNIFSELTPPPLIIAIEQFVGLVKLFVELGANVNLECDKSILFHHVVGLNNKIIELFLDYGGNYDYRNNLQLTPYMMAVYSKTNVQFIKYFIKLGCPYDKNINIQNAGVSFSTYRFFAIEKKFFEGIKNNDLNLLKDAVDAGAVITGCREQIRYPVHFLAFHGYYQLLHFLLEKGAPPNLLNKKGESALYIAAKRGHYHCCCTLLMFGACYNYLNRVNSETLIHNMYIVNLLKNVSKMFSLTYVGNKKVTAVLENLASNNINKYLIYANARNCKGDSILAIALNKNHTGIAQEMLKLRITLEL